MTVETAPEQQQAGGVGSPSQRQYEVEDDFVPDETPQKSGPLAASTGEALSGEPSKFASYDLNVDPSQNNKATHIRLCSFARPHMRSFHFAWWCYHVAFLMWFSISPLLSEVQSSLNLSKQQIWTSSITAVSGTVLMRFVLGPYCDKYGPRIPMAIILICSAIPTGLIGLVQTATGLAIIRFFIGIGGSTFVMCQYWMSIMFTKEIVGTANATTAGWGNLGGGITQIMMGSILFPFFRDIVYGGNTTKAWRTACVVPAMMGLITGICVYKYTDDSPKGNFSKLKKTGQMQSVSMVQSFIKGAKNLNTWFVFCQYACCFGVEITMNNAAAMYFKETFDMTTEQAAAVASIFGWMNLFARGTGGFISDKFNQRMGMNGRLLWQSICLAIEGGMVLIFAHVKILWLAIVIMVVFSIFVQAAEGSSYGIVPYIDPPVTGSISGIIGAGGNVGAVAFGFAFRQMSSKMAFITMGSVIVATSLFSIFVKIPIENIQTKTLSSTDLELDVEDPQGYEDKKELPLTPTTVADSSSDKESSVEGDVSPTAVSDGVSKQMFQEDAANEP